VVAQATPAEMLESPTPTSRADFETAVATARAEGRVTDAAPYRAAAFKLLAAGDAPRARDMAAAAFLLEPAHEDALRLERELLEHDGVAPFPRLDEAFSDYQAGRPQALRDRLMLVQTRVEGLRLAEILGQEAPAAEDLMLALAADLRTAYGTGGLRGRDLRRYLLQRATNGRSLLRPDAGPGLTYLGCLLAAAGALALSLMLGIGRR
jgi:hypothetical protein